MLLTLLALLTPPLSPAEVAENHDANFNQITSMAATLEMIERKEPLPDAATADSPGVRETIREVDWLWSRDAERIRIITRTTDEKTKEPRVTLDVYSNSDDGYQVMHVARYDLGRRPTKLDPAGTNAWMGPRSTVTFLGNIAVLERMWLRFSHRDQIQKRPVSASFSEIIRTAERAQIVENNPEIVRLNLQKAFGARVLDLIYDLSKKHGFMVSRVVNTSGDFFAEVTGWHHVGGLYFPKTIKSKSQTSKATITETVRIKEVRVNFAPSSGDFAPDFPEWTLVHNKATGELYLWGKGAPHMTFANGEEYKIWLEAERLDHGNEALEQQLTGSTDRTMLWYGVPLLVLLLVSGYLLWQRYLRLKGIQS